jgi:XTP/dITP diphosphohydrolase/tetrapyrrole methylase family protein/MazG family protein/ATP diphosphatase
LPRRLGDALLELDQITRRLRRDCPWDREQDERSIVPHTVEEAYELADAAHARDDAKLLDELGDVLFQVYFLALLLEERGQGDLAAVADGTVRKLVRRHPHVFGEEAALAELPTEARTPSEVRANWDEIKRGESAAASDPLATVPENLPGLLFAAKVQKRIGEPGPRAGDSAAHHGDDRAYDAIGTLLWDTVKLARELNVDPEIALRRKAERERDSARGARDGSVG